MGRTILSLTIMIRELENKNWIHSLIIYLNLENILKIIVFLRIKINLKVLQILRIPLLKGLQSRRNQYWSNFMKLGSLLMGCKVRIQIVDLRKVLVFMVLCVKVHFLLMKTEECRGLNSKL